MTTSERWAIEDLHLTPIEEQFVKDHYEAIKEIILENDSTIENLKGKVEELEADYSYMKDKVGRRDNRISDLEDELRVLKDENARLQETIDAMS